MMCRERKREGGNKGNGRAELKGSRPGIESIEWPYENQGRVSCMGRGREERRFAVSNFLFSFIPRFSLISTQKTLLFALVSVLSLSLRILGECQPKCKFLVSNHFSPPRQTHLSCMEQQGQFSSRNQMCSSSGL